MEIINQYLPLALQILQALGGLVVFATLVVRLPGVGGDKEVGVVASYWLKIVHWLPTIGVNPQTQKLQEALEEYQKQA